MNKGVKMDGHNKALAELLNALGLGNNRVVSFTLRASGRDPLLSLTAEIYVGKEDVTEVTEVLKKYELVERG
jgi:hypothetical protein